MSLIYFIISNILGCFAPRLNKMIYLYLFIFCSLSLLLSPSSFSLSFLMALWHHIVPPPLFVVIFPPSSFCCFPLSVFHSWFSLHATLSVYIHISIPDTRHDSRFSIPCVALFLSLMLARSSSHPSFSSHCPYSHSVLSHVYNDNTGLRRGVALRTVTFRNFTSANGERARE